MGVIVKMGGLAFGVSQSWPTPALPTSGAPIMAAAVITEGGLKKRLNATLLPRLFLRLFNNDVPVLPTSLLGEFQQATFPGYADLEVTGLWPAAQIDATGRAWSAIYNQTWTRGAGGVPETIYGWVLYESPLPDSVLVAGRRLTIPRTISLAGETIIESVIVYLLRG